jgi:hypothetical protein
LNGIILKQQPAYAIATADEDGRKMNININNYEAYFLDYHEGNLSPQQVADLFLFLSQHPELKKEFEDFEHIVLEDFSAPVFENKDRLKKNITVENREEYFIRAVEGTLDPTELVLLTAFLNTHPEFVTEFNLFQKTKLQADASVVFENKPLLKQGIVVNEEQLIAAVEGLLTKEEQLLLEQQLAESPELQRSFVAYQQTKAIADTSIIFKDKQALKRKERKVVPLYYYVAVAASIILLFSILFLSKINNTDTNTEQRFAERGKQPVIEQQKTVNPTTITPEKETKKLLQPSSPTLAAVKNAKTIVKKQLLQNKPVTNDPAVNTEKSVVAEKTLITKPVVASSDTHAEKQNPVVTPYDSVQFPSNKNVAPVMAQVEKKEAKQTFPSVGDLLTSRLKEKLMGKDAVEKETTPPTKITGWDIAGIFAKGLSKITGKKVEVKPQFNEQGNITAYALSAGKLEFSKGRMK